ncbi:MAG: hypothetical protein H0V67_00565 [Geodermatophilaceae bacterium]|nr:hypothetical protein [Geodermatophilaceae bacterium]
MQAGLRGKQTDLLRGYVRRVGDQDVHATARDPAWQAEYRQHRPMVERSIAWQTRGNRKVRYRGGTKNDH